MGTHNICFLMRNKKNIMWILFLSGAIRTILWKEIFSETQTIRILSGERMCTMSVNCLEN